MKRTPVARTEEEDAYRVVDATYRVHSALLRIRHDLTGYAEYVVKMSSLLVPAPLAAVLSLALMLAKSTTSNRRGEGRKHFAVIWLCSSWLSGFEEVGTDVVVV